MNSPRSTARDGFGYLLRGGIATLVIGVMTVMIPRPVGATSFPEELGLPIPLAITISAPTNMLTSLGGTVQLTVIAAFSDATNEDVTAGDKGTIYGTEDPAVAVVDGDGLVTAVGNGKTTIYANLGNNLDSIEITVETPERLDEDCIASILNRQVQVSPDGTFALGNVPVPVGAFRRGWSAPSLRSPSVCRTARRSWARSPSVSMIQSPCHWSCPPPRRS